MLGETCYAWMALAIMADATEVSPILIGEEDIGTEVDGLSSPLEAPASARKFAQIHRIVNCDEDIGVLRNRFACRQRAHEGNTQNARTSRCSPHERVYGEKQRPPRLGNRGTGTAKSIATHLRCRFGVGCWCNAPKHYCETRANLKKHLVCRSRERRNARSHVRALQMIGKSAGFAASAATCSRRSFFLDS
jgi:hypothetical protein